VLQRVVLLLAVTLAGCRPFHVDAFADADIRGDMRVSALMAPTNTEHPVVPMTVPAEDATSHARRIAVVDVDGLLLNTDMTGFGSLGENPVSMFRERLDAIGRDPRVVAVVVRINSPGGGVTATDIMWHDLMEFKSRKQLPVVACLMDTGTGGAYYLATAADQIISHPTSIVGGIGVILNHYNLQDAMAQFNIVGAPIKAGKKIDIGTPISPLDDESRQLLQGMADAFHDRFRKVVLDGRPEVNPNDPTNFDGRVYTAEQAVERKLIDRVGYLNDAIATASKVAGCGRVAVAFYHRPNDRAQSLYSQTPNVPLQGGIVPLSLPGLDRSRLPSFLYLWQLEPTMEKLGGK
jgi:protease-4